jgi:DNA-binding NtrC family response regulator
MNQKDATESTKSAAAATDHPPEPGLTDPDAIVGESPRIREIRNQVKTVSGADAPVLIQGERGTGKQLLARAIHASGSRRSLPFISTSYGTMPATVVAIDLFGQEKGARGGSQARKRGKLEMAQGGTIFIDEVGQLGPQTQVELLHVLETKRFTRVGSKQPIGAGARITCSSSRDLQRLVQEGRFREDLFYRSNVFTIAIPPLRERRSDIPLLANHFLKTCGARLKKDVQAISREAMDLLASHPWPGNIGELEEAIGRAMAVARGPSLLPADLPIFASREVRSAGGGSPADLPRADLLRILDACEWNMTRASEVLKVDRTALQAMVRRLGIEHRITD